MAQELWGDLYGDRGYISKALHDDLLANGLNLITLIRRNMKPRLMRLWDRLIAYTFQPKKPSLGLRIEESGLPVMI